MYLQFRSSKILKNANKSVAEKHRSSVTWEWGGDRVGQEVPFESGGYVHYLVRIRQNVSHRAL